MREIVRRAVSGSPELTAELLRRGMFRPEEKAELLRCHPQCNEESELAPLGMMEFTALLAQADSQFAARAVLRDMLGYGELRRLDRLLRFQKPNEKRDELARIVERAMEGRKGNVRDVTEAPGKVLINSVVKNLCHPCSARVGQALDDNLYRADRHWQDYRLGLRRPHSSLRSSGNSLQANHHAIHDAPSLGACAR